MPKKELKPGWIIFSIISLGFAEILTQLVLAREFLSVFYGNELVIGLLLANWLLIGGIGSYAGRWISRVRSRQRLLVIFHILVALLLPVSVYVIRNLYNFAFIRGELAGAAQISATTALVLLPACLITGFSLPLFSSLYLCEKKPRQIGKVYVFDSLSNIIGGLLFSFVLVYLFDAFQISLLVLVIELVAALLLSVKMKNTASAIFSAVLLAAGAVSLAVLDANMLTTQQQYPGQELLLAKDSPYGRLVVTRTAEQLNFYQNGVALFSTGDAQTNEEKVHYAMLQRPDAKQVLLLSGGVSGTALEVLKYNVSAIDYVELDPEIVRIGKAFTRNLDDGRIHTIMMDTRRYVREAALRQASEDTTAAERMYDVVIIDSPGPTTAQSNRLYTEEFFTELRKIMAPGGAVALRIDSGAEYTDEATQALDAAVYNSLKSVFRNALVLPGDPAYMLASDTALSYDAYHNISVYTQFVRKGYIDERLDRARIDDMYALLSQNDATNNDFMPVAYYHHLRYWLEHFQTNYLLFLSILVAFLIFVLWRISRTGFAVFSAGFAGISLELIILIGFQVIYGYAYSKIGIIITSFMAGLALGAWRSNRQAEGTPLRRLVKILLSLAAFSAAMPLILSAMRSTESPSAAEAISILAFPLMTIALGALVGALFPAAARVEKGDPSSVAGKLFFYDYAGACIGAVLVSVLLVPLLGVAWTCAIIALVLLSAAMINLRAKG